MTITSQLADAPQQQKLSGGHTVLDRTGTAITRHDLVRLGVLLAGALSLRWLCFAGLTLGDDPGYVSLVREIHQGRYVPAGGNPLAARPVFLTAVAISTWLVGWSEVGLVAPVLLA